MSVVLSLDNSRRMDIIVRKGASLDKTILVKNASNNTDFDFTGWTAVLLAYSSVSDRTPDITFAAGNGLTLAEGSITLSKTWEVMSKYRRHDFIYFLWMTNPAGKKKLWLNGLFCIQEGLYDDDTDSEQILIALNGDNVTLQIGAGISEPWRGEFDASVNEFPSSGGSNDDGSIKAGDTWHVTVEGTIDAGTDDEELLPVKTLLVALVNDPGQDQDNWRII